MERAIILCWLLQLMFVKMYSQTITIVIDPGHGYIDQPICVTGASGSCPPAQTTFEGSIVYNPDGRCNDEIVTTLAVGLKLKELLEANCSNVEVKMTRTSNIVYIGQNTGDSWLDNNSILTSKTYWPYMNASDRAIYANHNGNEADLFISIHTNAMGNVCGANVSGNGTETYVCDVYSSANLPNLYFSNDQSLGNLVNSNMITRGQFNQRYGTSNAIECLVSRTSHLGVLRFSNVNGKCLNEIGFHTNAADRAKLLSDSWRDEFARIYFDAIQSYFGGSLICSEGSTTIGCGISNSSWNSNFQFPNFPDPVDGFQVETVEGYLCSANDEDWIRFTTDQIGLIDVSLTHSSENYNVYLYKDNSGNSVRSSTSSGIPTEEDLFYINAHTSDRDYAIRIKGNSAGDFDSDEPYQLTFKWRPWCALFATRGSSSDLVVGPDVTICAGDTTQLWANGLGGEYYEWEPQTGLDDPYSATPLANPTVTTTYTVKCGLYDCYDEAEVTVYVEEVNTNASSNPSSICRSGTVQLNATHHNDNVYFWSPSDQVNCAFCEDPLSKRLSTSTTFSLVEITPEGCLGIDQTTVTVNQNCIANDNPCSAIEVPVKGILEYDTYSNVGATPTTGVAAPTNCPGQTNPNGLGGYNGGDVWFKFTMPASRAVKIESQADDLTDAAFAVYEGPCGSPDQIDCNDDLFVSGAWRFMPTLVMQPSTHPDVDAGDEVWVRFWDFNGNTWGDFGFTVRDLSPPDLSLNAGADYDLDCTELDISASIKNIGTSPAGPFSVGAYLSKNNHVLDNLDLPLPAESVNSLGVNNSVSISISVDIRDIYPTLSAGDYFVLLKPDAYDEVGESSELYYYFPNSFTLRDYESTAPISVTASAETICSSDDVVLTLSGGSLGYNADWEWYKNGCGSGSSIGSGNSIIVSPTSTTTYYVRGESTCSETGCRSVTIMVGEADADIEDPNSSIFCDNEGIDFEADNCNGCTYLWEFDDGFTSGSRRPRHSYLNPGSYNVTLTVSDDKGCTDDETMGITINSSPQINVVSITDEKCSSPGAVEVEVTGGNSLTYLWNDNSTNEDLNAVSAGFYSLTVTNNYNCSRSIGVNVNYLMDCDDGNACTVDFCDVGQCRQSLQVPAKPESIIGPATEVCANTTKVYSVNDSGYYYTWIPPVGAFTTGRPGNDSVSITFGSAFTGGTISVSATNECGTSSLKTMRIQSVPSQPGNITGPKYGICDSISLFSIEPVVGATGYFWRVTIPSQPLVHLSMMNYGDSVKVKFPRFTQAILSVYAYNACGFSTVRTMIVHGTLLTTGTINGDRNPCQGSIQSYSIPPDTQALWYEWIEPSGYVIESGDSTESIQLKIGTQKGTLQVKAVNKCGSGTVSAIKITPTTCGSSSKTEVDDNISDFIGTNDLFMKISPIPSDEKIKVLIVSNKSGNCELEIVDISGKRHELTNSQLLEGENVIFLTVKHLPNGMYFLKYQNELGHQTKPFIVQHSD